MIKNLFKTALLFALIALVISVKASPSFGDKYQLRQPDQTLVSVKIWGDEFSQRVESMDGYTLLRDSSGWICYAALSAGGNQFVSTTERYVMGQQPSPALVSTGKALRISPQMERKQRLAAMKARGVLYNTQPTQMKRGSQLPDTIVGLTVIVNFADTATNIPLSDFKDFCNADVFTKYGCFSSVKRAFQRRSSGKFTYLNEVVGIYTVKHDLAFYDKPNAHETIDSLLEDVLAQVKASGFDFNKLTIENNKIRALNILYTGSALSGWGQGLWPHKGRCDLTFNANGIKAEAYMISGISHAVKPTDLSINAFCHESGHLVCGWPDFYSLDDHFDNYNDMAGDYYMDMPSPYQRQMLGWVEFTDITNVEPGTVVKLKTDGPKCAVYRGTNTGSPAELYYIDARDYPKTGNVFNFTSKKGLTVWRINSNGSNQWEYYPEFQEIVWNSQERIDQTGDTALRFNDASSPSASWHIGKFSGLDILHVKTEGDYMSFQVGSTKPYIQNLPLADMGISIPYSHLFVVNGGTPPYRFSFIEGELPQGIFLTSNGLLHGTTPRGGNYKFSFSVSDSKGISTRYDLNIDVRTNGLVSQTYQTQGLTDFPQYDQLLKIDSGVVRVPSVTRASYLTQYARTYTGFLKIDQEGDYTFFSKSSDGSRLTIDNQAVVSHGGVHSISEKSGNLHLTVGYHPVLVEYFTGSSLPYLQLSYQRTGLSKQVIPDSLYFIHAPAEINPMFFITKTLSKSVYQATYNSPIKIDGGKAPLSYRLLSGNLPSGLQLTNQGVLSGSTNELGSFFFELEVTDAAGDKISKLFTLLVENNGLMCHKYDAPNKVFLPLLSSLSFIDSNIVSNVMVKDGGLGLAYHFSGYIDIQTAADYTFYLKTSMGVKLMIDDATVVSDPMICWGCDRSGTKNLAIGRHKINVEYMKSNEANNWLNLSYSSSAGMAKQLVPDSVLYLSGTSTTTQTVTISATQSQDGGMMYPAVSQLIINKGRSQTYRMKPNQGFRVKDVLVDGQSKGAVSEYSFESISTDHSISVVFEAQNQQTPIADTLYKPPYVNLQPNPANTFINITLNLDAQLQIYRCDGLLVHSQVLRPSTTPISVEHLSSGMYMLVVQSPSFVWHKSLLVIH